jgi:hypothetical protein
VVTLRHFRGEVGVEEAGFFVREIDLGAGTVRLSDGSEEPLAPETLRTSPIDGALLCTVKRGLAPEGLAARFIHAAQAELLAAAFEAGEGHAVLLAGETRRLPVL